MTSNKRAKRDARDRAAKTGEPYVVARRRTAQNERYFEPDCCANCLRRLPDDIDGLFCSELCSQTAKTIRYWRRIARDGRISQPDVQEAIRTRVAHLLAGGYHEAARQLSPAIRSQVWDRDGGRCVLCGQQGAEIDHITGDSPDLGNLQLLCTGCHQAKTAARMRPASKEQRAEIGALYTARVEPEVPALLCDDEQRWANEWAALKKARRQRLLDLLNEMGMDPDEFRGASRAEILDAIEDERDAYGDALDAGGWTEDDDTGYGPYSYFAHAMAKDD
jgi:5-methylcytosine-specific restriction endonuclease McrA